MSCRVLLLLKRLRNAGFINIYNIWLKFAQLLQQS